MITIGKIAPDIQCDAVIDGQISKFNLHSQKHAFKVLFFYPLDFTFVCPTELHALQELQGEFAKRDAAVYAISVDSAYSHLAWLDVPKNRGGIAGVSYPLLADITKSIARDFGVLNESLGVALRGVFVLDRDNVVQHCAINNLPLGRNINELLRIIDALNHVQHSGEVCPANWDNSQQALKATKQGVQQYFQGA